MEWYEILDKDTENFRWQRCMNGSIHKEDIYLTEEYEGFIIEVAFFCDCGPGEPNLGPCGFFYYLTKEYENHKECRCSLDTDMVDEDVVMAVAKEKVDELVRLTG